jgi:ubiquinone/menaquinone biosynthesis C-methylase UbiE
LYKQKTFEKWYIKLSRRKLIRTYQFFVDEWWNYTNSITVKTILKYSPKPSLILDVGCGEGRLLKDIAKSKRSVIGIDPSRVLLNDAKHLLSKLNKNCYVDLILAVGEYLPFRSGSFDAILCAATLEHLISPMKFLKEAKECLKKGGVICIKQGYEKRVKKPQIDHMRSFTYQEIIKLLDDSNLTIIHIKQIGSRALWSLTYPLQFIPLRKLWLKLFEMHVSLGYKNPRDSFLAIIIAKV